MVDLSSGRVSRAPPYSLGWFEDFGLRLRGFHALRPGFPAGSAVLVFLTLPSGLLPVRSPLLRESLLISFPGLLRWFTSPSVAPPAYFIQLHGVSCLTGYPIRRSGDIADMCSSPRLIAACHVLHRLSSSRASAMDLYSLGHIASSPFFYLHSFPVHFKHLGSGLTAFRLLWRLGDLNP